MILNKKAGVLVNHPVKSKICHPSSGGEFPVKPIRKVN